MQRIKAYEQPASVHRAERGQVVCLVHSHGAGRAAWDEGRPHMRNKHVFDTMVSWNVELRWQRGRTRATGGCTQHAPGMKVMSASSCVMTLVFNALYST